MNLSKKILFITHVGNPGGAEFKAIKMAKSIYNSHFIMFAEGIITDILTKNDISYTIVPMPDELTGFRREHGFSSMLKVIPKLFSMVKNLIKHMKNYDAIVCVSQKSFIISALAKPFVRKPIIWLMNDIISKEHFNPVIIKLLVYVFRYAPDYVVLNSDASYQAWCNSGGRKKNVDIIYPGTDVENIFSQIENVNLLEQTKALYCAHGEKLIGIFGRISSWKGQDIFLQALSHIPYAKGIIVGGAQFGEDDYADSLKEMAETLGIADRIIFTGHHDNAPLLMIICDVITHCSTSPEPFGQVIVEAMASGTPVIASNAGGAKEIIVPDVTGQLTPIGDVEALVTAIKRYLNDPEWSSTIAIAAQKRALEHFSTEAMNQKFHSLLEKVFSEKSS